MIEHPRILNRPHLVRVEAGVLPVATNFTWTPPARQHVELISVTVILSTDATVTNRRMRLVIGGVADDDAIIIASQNQLASTLIPYSFLRGFGYDSGALNLGGHTAGLPLGLLFANPEQLRSEIINFQAGDQITGYNIRYMMWQDPVIIP